MSATFSQTSYVSPAPSVPRPVLVNQHIGERFGQRLRDLRKSRGMTQLYMAESFGIDRSYISEIECGKQGVSLATLEVFALGFRIDLAALLSNL